MNYVVAICGEDAFDHRSGSHLVGIWFNDIAATSHQARGNQDEDYAVIQRFVCAVSRVGAICFGENQKEI